MEQKGRPHSNYVMIEMKDVWKEYAEGKVAALRGINLKIKKGDFISIMGPSGSGKSTCMNLIGLLDSPTKGKVFVDGKDVSKLDDDSLARMRGKKLGFIFQQFNLIQTLTAKENVLLPIMFQQTLTPELNQKAVELLKSVGLGDRVNHRPSQLSGGEQQRVAIARSLINEPEILLADEPTGNLDSKTGEQIMKILEDLHHKGKTVVVITHDPRIAGYAHERVNIIDGQIAKDHELSKSYLWKRK